jgi:hypothetical protein
MIGRRITATELPQTVAALHSVVGLAAVLTSIGSVMAGIGDITTLHLVTAYLGVLIGNSRFAIDILRSITDSLSPRRWCHIYRFNRCVLEACWPHVFEAPSSPRPTLGKHITSYGQCRNNGRVCYHGAWCTYGRCSMPWRKYCT